MESLISFTYFFCEPETAPQNTVYINQCSALSGLSTGTLPLGSSAAGLSQLPSRLAGRGSTHTMDGKFRTRAGWQDAEP